MAWRMWSASCSRAAPRMTRFHFSSTAAVSSSRRVSRNFASSFTDCVMVFPPLDRINMYPDFYLPYGQQKSNMFRPECQGADRGNFLCAAKRAKAPVSRSPCFFAVVVSCGSCVRRSRARRRCGLRRARGRDDRSAPRDHSRANRQAVPALPRPRCRSRRRKTGCRPP